MKGRRMKDENFITIQGWMVNRLELKGNELILFALIYGFSQDGESRCKCSIKYATNALGVARNTALGMIEKLIERGLIIKHTNTDGLSNEYSVAIDVIESLRGKTRKNVENTDDSCTCEESSRGGAKIALGGVQKLHWGGAKIAHNIYSYNNSNNIPSFSNFSEEKFVGEKFEEEDDKSTRKPINAKRTKSHNSSFKVKFEANEQEASEESERDAILSQLDFDAENVQSTKRETNFGKEKQEIYKYFVKKLQLEFTHEKPLARSAHLKKLWGFLHGATPQDKVSEAKKLIDWIAAQKWSANVSSVAVMSKQYSVYLKHMKTAPASISSVWRDAKHESRTSIADVTASIESGKKKTVQNVAPVVKEIKEEEITLESLGLL